LRPLVDALGGFDGTPWTADAVHLIESRLGAKPMYTTLGTWPFAARPDQEGE
jgi:2'-5' RNA ligase